MQKETSIVTSDHVFYWRSWQNILAGTFFPPLPCYSTSLFTTSISTNNDSIQILTDMLLLRRLLIIYYSGAASAFAPSLSAHRLYPSPHRPSKTSHAPKIIATHRRESQTNDSEGNEALSCWNPDLRKQLGAISGLGLGLTAYLTYDKLQYAVNGKTASFIGAICSSTENGASSSCNDVLHGPYASLHLGTLDVPLSVLGMTAYGTIFVLATLPLISAHADGHKYKAVLDGVNRVALLGGTTLMASFSIYLISILVRVIHASCLFCFVSAGLSITMAGISWFGGVLPSTEETKSASEKLDSGSKSQVAEIRKKGVVLGASSVGIATMLALGLFLGVRDETDNSNSPTGSSSKADTGTLLASIGSSNSYQDNVPPPITTKSSSNAIALASELKALDSRMFGAFWCSHCYDQKQAFGYEAMQYLPYIECDREGYNSKRDICRERDIPGYPTWEIGGKLFPGERSLEELREIVDDIRLGK